jgi:hypothetical protein
MQHSFDINIAKEYGIEAAIILNNLHFWHERNKANEKHFYDGIYWTYNSVTGWMKLFPYMSRDKIKNSLSKLKESGLIMAANYNENKYDKTLWYGLTDFALSILQNTPMEFANSINREAENAKPIPIINTVNKKTNINYKPQSNENDEFDIEKENKPPLMNDKTWELFKEWWNLSRKQHKLSNTKRAFDLQVSKMKLKIQDCYDRQYEVVQMAMNYNKDKTWQNINLPDDLQKKVDATSELIRNAMEFA